MSASASLRADYQRVVIGYLAEQSEARLQEAYELGRRALGDGLGILDLVAIHEGLVDELTAAAAATEQASQTRSTARRTLRELLAPFELAFRGFREATDRLRSSARELERRVVERTVELHAAELRFRSLVEQIPGVTYLAAPRGPRLFSYVSPQIERLLGIEPSHFSREAGAWAAHIHPEDRSRVAEAWLEAGERELAFQAQYRLLGPGRRTIWVEDQASLVAAEAGALRQGIVLDTSERRSLEEQVRQSQKMETVGRLAGGVAHDFNNLLSVILTYSSLHRVDLPEGHPLRDDLAEIQHAGRRAAALTRQLLAFSRHDRIEPRTVDLNSVLRNTESMLSRLIGEHFRLESLYAPEAGCVFIDPGQLEQVIMNLVVNARDAMPEGGTLRLQTALRHSTLEGGERVELAVVDQGTGMTDEVRARAFEPFFTTKPLGKGTGIGLATCFGIVDQAGGRIELDSELGKGTTVRVLLPRSRELPLEGSGATLRAPEGHGETVLVVEDDPQVRQATSRLLETLGYRVLKAADGEEALRVIEGRDATGPEVRLVLTDVNMPGLNGRSLAIRLRAARPKLKIMFASGYADSVIAQSQIKELGLPLIQKPFTLEELSRKVDEVLKAT